jgi:hypothetical protein
MNQSSVITDSISDFGYHGRESRLRKFAGQELSNLVPATERIIVANSFGKEGIQKKAKSQGDHTSTAFAMAANALTEILGGIPDLGIDRFGISSYLSVNPAVVIMRGGVTRLISSTEAHRMALDKMHNYNAMWKEYLEKENKSSFSMDE